MWWERMRRATSEAKPPISKFFWIPKRPRRQARKVRPTRTGKVGGQPHARPRLGSTQGPIGREGLLVKADHEPTTVPGPGAGDFTQETRTHPGPPGGRALVRPRVHPGRGGERRTRKPPITPCALTPKPWRRPFPRTSHPQGEQWYSNKKVEVAFLPPHDLSGIEGYYYCIDHEPMTLPDPIRPT